MSRYSVRRKRIAGEKERKKKALKIDPNLGKQLVKERKAVLTTQHGQKFGTKAGDVKRNLEAAKLRQAEEAKGTKFRAPAPGVPTAKPAPPGLAPTPPQFKPVEEVAQPSPLAAEPIVAPGALAPEMVTPGLIAEQQQFQETPTPEGFAGDVAQATALGLSAIALGVAIAPGAAGLAGSAGLTSPTIARAASGGIVKETGKVIFGSAARNTKNAKKTMSLLSRLAKTPLGLGIMGTYAFSVHLSLNDRSDTIMSLGIALNDAKRSGDLKRAKELMVIIEDVNSAGTIIEAFAPLINYPLAAIRKAELTMEAGTSMIKQMEDTTYELTPYEAAKRAEAEEYWAGVIESRGGQTEEKIKEQKRRAEAERTAIHAGR